MKYNISNPQTGQQKVLDIDDDKINRHFNDRRMGSDVDGGILGDEFKGYTLRITGGNDKQGFSMKQGVMVNGRVKILMKARTQSYRPRRLGPKRVGKIRKAFSLRKKDDVRKYVVKREIAKGDKTYYKSPKIQRLITEKRLRRKSLNKKGKIGAWKASRESAQAYEKLLSKFLKEKKAKYKQDHKQEAPKKTQAAKK